jgi:hypothetical protein
MVDYFESSNELPLFIEVKEKRKGKAIPVMGW